MKARLMSTQYTLGYRILLVLSALLVLGAAAMTVDILLHPLQPEAYYGSVAYRLVGGLLIAPLIIFVGVLCIRYSPGNIVGLLLVVAGAGSSFTYARADADLLLVNMLGTLGVGLFWTSFILLLLYFPDGKPYFGRIGIWMGRGMGLVILLAFASQILGQPKLSYSAQGIGQEGGNPFYVPELAMLSGFGSTVFPLFASAYMIFVFVSLVARFRAAGVRERQQLKWFLWGFVMWMAPQMLTDVPGIPHSISDAVGVYSIIGAGLLPVITVGPAILLNKLWDIDIIIRRTLVYSVLTALLALVYWVGVAGLQSLLRPLAGEGNDLAIVATTLAVVVLFMPLRRVVQAAIDRRFYRRKYDAAKTLSAFSQTARDEVDLDKLASRLAEVVDETMQPAHVSVWLASTHRKA